jgi:hypothetical protein
VLYYGEYTLPSIWLLLGATALLVAVLALRLDAGFDATVPVPLVAAGAALFTALVIPAGLYGSGRELTLSHALTAVVAIVVFASVIFSRSLTQLGALLLVVVVGAAGVAMVLSSPHPLIDDWYMLQSATAAITHGHNFYAVRWSAHIPGEASNIFVYLPGSAVLLWPFHLLFGDVRYGLLFALLFSAVLLVRLAPRGSPRLLAPLFLCYPGLLFGLEQSWVEPLVIAALIGAAYAVERGRPRLAVVAFALALCCKQTAWLAIPLAMTWRPFGWRRTAVAVAGAAVVMAPWLLANPHRFYSGAISYNLDLPARSDALSLIALGLHHNVHLGFAPLVVATVAMYALVIRRAPKTTSGFLLGLSGVVAVFNITNKIAFYNEWELPASLLLAAVVFRLHELAAVEPPTPGAPVALDEVPPVTVN